MMYKPATRLDDRARNFRHIEVARSHTATRLGIDNTPSAAVLERATSVAIHVLQPIRNTFGPFSPQSWFRCEQLEKVLTRKAFVKWRKKHKQYGKGQAWHRYFERKSHPKGEAVDIEVPGLPNDELFDWIKENLAFDQLIREFPRAGDPMSGWVHISWRSDEENRNQAFTIG